MKITDLTEDKLQITTLSDNEALKIQGGSGDECPEPPTVELPFPFPPSKPGDPCPIAPTSVSLNRVKIKAIVGKLK